TLGQHPLKHSLFPVGEMNKSAVRKLAESAGFVNHAKKDSTGICFIGERKFKDFLQQYLPAQPGDIQTTDGKVIGRHHGLMYYTLGQRKGLGIGGVKGSNEEAWYSLSKDLEHNILVVGQGEDHPLLFHSHLKASQLHWINNKQPGLPFSCKAKVRYRQPDQNCEILSFANGSCTVKFDQPQRAITPGQSIVFYQDDICLGGGVIDNMYNESL
ncbi:MAG: tRNA 2-thiouridine(34) synthase MnmA, partial [Gammaproteobacteria bacterium]|nr:tRNA 2-thiouridine(34) synthase MnmA [Gammaproteobacteria bacterium]